MLITLTFYPALSKHCVVSTVSTPIFLITMLPFRKISTKLYINIPYASNLHHRD